MSVYAETAVNTIKLIKKAGRVLVFTKSFQGDEDPVTGKYPPPVLTHYSVNAVTLDYTSKNSGSGTIEGTTIKTGDKKILIGYEGYYPDSDDYLMIGNVQFQIVNFTEVAPDGTPILFEIQARK